MKNNLKTNSRNFRLSILRSGVLLITNLMLFAYTASAQSDGPSIENAKKNVKAIGQEMAREEKLSYIGMIVGFILVMVIAWVSTVKAKQRRIAHEELIRRRHAMNKAKHNIHDPYYKHHGHGHHTHATPNPIVKPL